VRNRLVFCGLLLATRLATAVGAPDAAAPQSQSQSPEFFPGSSAVFATAADGARILSTEDAFVRAMSPFDRSARLEVDRPVPVAEYLAFVAKQTRDWTPAERTKVSDALAEFRRRTTALALDLKYPARVSFVKTTGREEGGAAYCRGPVVVLTESELASPPEKLRTLVFHELFHVERTHDPGRRRELYRIVGFDVCPEIALPASLRDRKITNPDAFTIDSFIRVRDAAGAKVPVTPVLYARGEKWDPKAGGPFFRQMVFSLLVLEEEGGGKLRPAASAAGEPRVLDPSSTPDYLEQIGRNTEYVIHPEEILADNFALLVTGASGAAVQTPRILEALKAALSKPASPAAPAAAAPSFPAPEDREALERIQAFLAQGGKDKEPAEKVFKNIELLRGKPASRLPGMMTALTGLLSVRCAACHVEGNFASDDLAAKKTARRHFAMQKELNEKYFAGANAITCFTCHRGRRVPETFDGR
jgi:hypothetical protein